MNEHTFLLSGGTALDLAAGMGSNALCLARYGYEVEAIDISLDALRRLQSEARLRKTPVNCLVADLDCYPLPRQRYDLVCIFYFFSPSLMPSIINSLKLGGLLFYATFNHLHRSIKPEFNPAYLVPPHGLLRYFPQFLVLLNEESAGKQGNICRLIARKSQNPLKPDREWL